MARFLDLGFPMAALLLDSESTAVGKLLSFGYLPVGLAGVLLTASRGGFLAALVALAGCGLLLARSHVRGWLAGAFALPAIAAGFWFLCPHETLERITVNSRAASGRRPELSPEHLAGRMAGVCAGAILWRAGRVRL